MSRKPRVCLPAVGPERRPDIDWDALTDEQVDGLVIDWEKFPDMLMDTWDDVFGEQHEEYFDTQRDAAQMMAGYATGIFRAFYQVAVSNQHWVRSETGRVHANKKRDGPPLDKIREAHDKHRKKYPAVGKDDLAAYLAPKFGYAVSHMRNLIKGM